MYITNVVNSCIALNNNYDTTIIQYNLFFCVASLVTHSLFSDRVGPMPSILHSLATVFQNGATLAHTENEETGHNIVYSM